MRARGLAAALTVAVTGCVGSPMPRAAPDARLQTLVTQPVADFLADARIASLLAEGCPKVVMTAELFNALIIARETSRGNAAPFEREAVAREAQVAFDLRSRDLRTRYLGDPFRRETCPLVEAETARGAPATGFLSPVPGPAAKGRPVMR